MYKLKPWLLSPIRTIRFVYNDSSISSTLKELITQDKSVTLHNRSTQVFVNEMFKVKKAFL